MLRRFGSHWTTPAVSERQSAYGTLHENLVHALELEAIRDEGSRTRGAGKQGDRR